MLENPMEFVSFVKIHPLAKLKAFQCWGAIQSDNVTSRILFVVFVVDINEKHYKKKEEFSLVPGLSALKRIVTWPWLGTATVSLYGGKLLIFVGEDV